MGKPTLIILAGGKGTRLGKLTKNIPKPMVEVCGKPFLYWAVKHYEAQGFRDFIFSTGYKAEVLEDYPWGIKNIIQFWHDEQTGGPEELYGYPDGEVYVNGDTFIPDPLPNEPGPWILSCGDIDAGAQRPGVGKIKIIPTTSFYDIGTPEGLARFTEYCETHLVKNPNVR